MAESVAIPSFQTLVQISKRLKDVSGQIVLHELVVAVSELLSDPGLVRAVVLNNHVMLRALRESVRSIVPRSLIVTDSIIVATFVALTAVKSSELCASSFESRPESLESWHRSRPVITPCSLFMPNMPRSKLVLTARRHNQCKDRGFRSNAQGARPPRLSRFMAMPAAHHASLRGVVRCFARIRFLTRRRGYGCEHRDWRRRGTWRASCRSRMADSGCCGALRHAADAGALTEDAVSSTANC